MPRFPSLHTSCIVGLCMVLLLGPWGCATKSLPHYAEGRAALGRIGVVSARYTPAFEFALPAKGWLGGAARGAVGGTKAFIVLVPSAAVVGGASMGLIMGYVTAPYGIVGALWSVAALVKGAGYLIVGPFYGAASAETAMTVEESEARLKAGLADMRIQETMRDHVIKAAQLLANRDVTVIDGQGPESVSNLLSYFPLHDSTIDTVLELRVTRVWLSANESFFAPVRSMIPSKEAQTKSSQTLMPDVYHELEINPELTLGMEVRGRLIRTADKVVLFDNTWEHEGDAHLFAEWAANDARLFAAELERAYDVLSDQMVASIF